MAKGTPLLLPPTREEIIRSAKEIGLPEREALKFFNFYESKGWMVGKNRMVSFRGALENWKMTWEDRTGGEHPAPAFGVRAASRQPMSGMDKLIAQKEFDRVVDRMRVLKASYGEMQTWSTADGLEFKKLVARRNELKKILGITI